MPRKAKPPKTSAELAQTLAECGFYMRSNRGHQSHDMDKVQGKTIISAQICADSDGKISSVYFSQSASLGPEEIGKINVADPKAVLRLLSRMAKVE